MQRTATGRGWRRASRGTALAAVAVFAACVLLRAPLLTRHALWTDEFFSLAIATGHSLEHRADAADPSQGDYVESSRAEAPAVYSRYLEHATPVAGLDRVLRAALLSDTSPPLYYVLLWGWTRAFGTSGAALRWFSVLCALLCLPWLWSLARSVGGRVAALPTVVLFTFSPFCVNYSTEGRMYSLLLLCSVSSLCLTVRLTRDGCRAWSLCGWIAVAVAGLLTHYFFVFVWGAALALLMIRPGRCPRVAWISASIVAALLVLPWYVHVPETMAAWRVTGGWQKLPPGPLYSSLAAHLLLPWNLLSTRGYWGGALHWDLINAAVLLLLAALAWRRMSFRWLAGPRLILWCWLAGACLGPVVLDLLQGTYLVAQSRYTLAGLPAILVLVGVAAGRLPPFQRTALLAMIALLGLIGVRRMYLNESRCFSPFRQVAALVAQQAGPADLILVHSVPSGVAGIARCLQEQRLPEATGFASWVGQLGRRRVPDDVLQLADGRRRIIVVQIHTVGEPAPQVEWLTQHATLQAEQRIESAKVSFFVPRTGAAFQAGQSTRR